ncbi:MAG: tripartite tricarboxylate transporter substrate-binding protein [Rhodospirillaceae bacterium]
MQRTKVLGVLATAAALAVPVAHAAQTAFPEKPIRLVLGSAAGSGPDIISRAIADRLYGAWGQRVVVDPRPGVAGVLSADLVLRAAPDGYTWMMLTSQLLVATNVYSNIKFNLAKDFASMSLIGTTAFTLVTHPDLPAKSIPELIELAKKQPLRYGSAGTGASEHLSAVLLTTLTKTDMLHVPYKGVAEAIAATLGKEVNFTFGVVPAVVPHVQAGRLRALGVTGVKRNFMLPDVPSIGEFIPGYQMLAWYSIVAPTGTPVAILEKASAEVQKAVKDPQFGEQLKTLGLEIVGSTRAELDAFRADQTRRISSIVKTAGITAQ